MTDRKTACNSNVTNINISTVYKGKLIYFCEQECLDEFLADSEKFINSDHFLLTFDLLPDVA